MSNHIDVETPLGQSYFTVHEQSLYGDCKTIYNHVHVEIGKEMQTFEHLPGGLSQVKAICKGKKYWQINKTRDFDNCNQRPIFERKNGVGAVPEQCDTAKGRCKDIIIVSM